MKKYKCNCGYSVFTLDDIQEIRAEGCPYLDAGPHIIKEIPESEYDGEDWMILWEDELENANRHSLTDLPRQVLDAMENEGVSPVQASNVMKWLYKNDVGI